MASEQMIDTSLLDEDGCPNWPTLLAWTEDEQQARAAAASEGCKIAW